uniref:C2H2-type domain-containing protein n=1 Tax=Parastrongyloides trichosuri TaxID=131310 RepID=A0A0N4ZHW9_PARTI
MSEKTNLNKFLSRNFSNDKLLNGNERMKKVKKHLETFEVCLPPPSTEDGKFIIPMAYPPLPDDKTTIKYSRKKSNIKICNVKEKSYEDKRKTLTSLKNVNDEQKAFYDRIKNCDYRYCFLCEKIVEMCNVSGHYYDHKTKEGYPEKFQCIYKSCEYRTNWDHLIKYHFVKYHYEIPIERISDFFINTRTEYEESDLIKMNLELMKFKISSL